MSISKYKAFLAVIEFGSITKASKALQYSQPGISHMISSLEEDLGFSVVKRVNGTFVPTENGKRIIGYCQQIVRSEENLKDAIYSINGLLTGKISIGSYNSLLVDFIPKAVSDFCKVYSGIEFSITEGDNDGMRDGLINSQFDLAFSGSEVAKGFHFIPLFHDPIGLIMHESHPFRKYDKIPINILNGCYFVMPSTASKDVIDTIMKKEPFNPSVSFSSNSDMGIVNLVSCNVGVSVLSSFHKQILPKNVIFKEFEKKYYRVLGISMRSTEYVSPAVKEFVKYATERAAENEFYYQKHPDID